jgi:hypothetical protein
MTAFKPRVNVRSSNCTVIDAPGKGERTWGVLVWVAPLTLLPNEPTKFEVGFLSEKPTITVRRLYHLLTPLALSIDVTSSVWPQTALAPVAWPALPGFQPK